MMNFVNLHELCQQLINKEEKGIFCEIGCSGQPLAQAIYNIPGASKTVYFSESPYNKKYQQNKFLLEECIRSVSYEAVKQMVKYYVYNHHKDVDFIYVASFQIGGSIDTKIATHGWIGIYKNGVEKYYHLSIYENLSRIEYAQLIAEQGLKLLLGIEAKFIDNVKIPKEENLEILEALKHFISYKSEQFLYFNKKGQMSRYEEVFREKTISLYRGSFNPPHLGHQKVRNTATLKPTFCISVDTFEKGILNLEDLLQRLELLKELEIDVLLCKGKYYVDLIKHLRYRYKEDILFVLGSDTLERIQDSTPEVLETPNIKWEIFQRPNTKKAVVSNKNIIVRPFDLDISSTQIREILKADKVEKIKLKNLVDDKIIDKLLKKKSP